MNSTAKISKATKPSFEIPASGMDTHTGEQPLGRGRDELRLRTKNYALEAIGICQALPPTMEAQILSEGLLRAAVAVGAIYREACRAKTDTEFLAKLDLTLSALDETAYWLELIEGSGLMRASEFQGLPQETVELTAIFMTIVRKIKQRPVLS